MQGRCEVKNGNGLATHRKGKAGIGEATEWISVDKSYYAKAKQRVAKAKQRGAAHRNGLAKCGLALRWIGKALQS